MAPTAHRNTGSRTDRTYRPDRPVHDTGTPERHDRTEPSPIPQAVRCRSDADGVTVWVPREDIDDTHGEDTEA
jgi:hypothetical protein